MSEPTDIKRLRELLSKSSERPWGYDAMAGTDDYEDPDQPFVQDAKGKPLVWFCTDLGVMNDVRLCAETINALPALLDELEQLREFKKEAMQAINIHAEEQCAGCIPLKKKWSKADE